MSAKFDIIDSAYSQPDRTVADQVERILRSEGFRSSEILRNLLSYLLTAALESRSEPPKVREIAQTVFGRPENFDSQTDSVVRVHTGRLRAKLAEYYMGEGAEDDLIITIPKGAYALSWQRRQTAALPAPEPNLQQDGTVPGESITWAQRLPGTGAIRVRTALLLVAASVLVTAVLAVLITRKIAGPSRPPALKTFWRPFTGNKEPTLVVFSNFRLVGSLNSGLQAYGQARLVKDQPVIDTYTTMGEVMGVFEVGRLLTLWRQPVKTKRSRLLTWDEAKDSNLIFIGGPLAETPLRDVPVLKDLQFKDGPIDPNHKAGAVINLHPRPGEEKIYYGSEGHSNSDNSSKTDFDYAVVALRPGLTQSHSILVAAGIAEFGTQAAAEFVTREERVQELLAALHADSGHTVPFFEALLRVRIEGGVPIQADVVLAHMVN